MSESPTPVAGTDYPKTHQQLQQWFADENDCLEYLERLRWPHGFVCPKCKFEKGWKTSRRGQWMCALCGRQTSVTAGTIFHRSRTPLSTWFAAIWYICASKNGISGATLQQVFGFGSYETAWAWLHKLRRAMVRPAREMLTGTVELDYVLVGGRSKGRAGGSSHKVPVMVAVEVTDERQIGRVRLSRADAVNSNELRAFAKFAIAPGSTIRTDGAGNLRRLSEMGFTHEYHSMISSKEPAHEVMPGVHLVASLLKRWLAGTLHYGIAKEKLDYYLDEYTFRFNRRHSRSRGLLFYRLVQQAVATDPHPLKALTSENETL